MLERIFNLYYFFEDGYIVKIGITEYTMDGNDYEKGDFLKSRVNLDYKSAVTREIDIDLPNSEVKNGRVILNVSFAYSKQRLGSFGRIFDGFYSEMKIKNDAFVVLTPIVDGVVRIDASLDSFTIIGQTMQSLHFQEGFIMKDYLMGYSTENGLDVPKLLNDDFFSAIRLTYNNKKYVSSVKLLMSAIDTFSYLEYGDVIGSFQKWLNEFSDLASLNITPDELWEYRNSILHMTNLSSRRVRNGSIRKISLMISTGNNKYIEDRGILFFDLRHLISLIGEALKNWIKGLNRNLAKLEIFVNRYDEITSDARLHVAIE